MGGDARPCAEFPSHGLEVPYLCLFPMEVRISPPLLPIITTGFYARSLATGRLFEGPRNYREYSQFRFESW